MVSHALNITYKWIRGCGTINEPLCSPEAAEAIRAGAADAVSRALGLLFVFPGAGTRSFTGTLGARRKD